MRIDCVRLTVTLGIIGAALVPSMALGRITPEDYRNVGVAVPANAAIPPTVTVTDGNGRQGDLKALISRPTVLVFADYKCRTLCGPILDFVGAALENSGLDGNRYRLLVVGLDPKDGPEEADALRHAHIEAGSALDRATRFVTADVANIERLTTALGYRYHYSAGDDVYVHPAAAYVFGADARVSRVLTGLGLSGADMRLALIEASDGKIGTFGDQIRLLCSGFDPAHGVYTVKIWRMLQLTTFATILSVGVGILLLARRQRP